MSSEADLKKQLDDALARITELEEENAGLRAEMGIRLEEADKRREELQKKREELLVQVEQEEEYLTNTLQGKLRELRESKVELENQLEIEEEYLTNKLQKQLAAVLQEKETTAARLEEERALREKYEQMCRESERARQQLQKEEERGERLRKRNEELKAELRSLRTDNFVLERQVDEDKEQLVTVKQQKAELQLNLEAQTEREFNFHRKRSKRHRSISAPCNKKKGVDSTAAQTTTRAPMSPRPIRSLPLPVQPAGGAPILSPRLVSPTGQRAVPVAIPSPRGMYGTSPAFGSPPIADSFSPFSKEKCVKRGPVRMRDSDNVWHPCMLLLYSSGNLVCTSDTGTVRINLDLVSEVSESWQDEEALPPYSLKISMAMADLVLACDTKPEFTEWVALITELCPLIS